MMRFLYSIGFLVPCMGLSLQAANNLHVLHPVPVKATTASSTTQVKDQSRKGTKTATATSKAAPATTSKQESRLIATGSPHSSTSKTHKSPEAVSHAAPATPHRSMIGAISERLARGTAYWAGEGDRYTG